MPKKIRYRKRFRKFHKKQRKSYDIMKMQKMRIFAADAVAVKQMRNFATKMITVQTVSSFNNSTGVLNGGIQIAPSGAAQHGQLAFQLDDLAQVATFTALFDQYRFEEVQLIFQPSGSTLLGGTSIATTNVPKLYIVIDRDNTSTLGSVTNAQQYDNCQVLTPNQGCDIKLRPSITQAITTAGAVAGSCVKPPCYLDCGTTTVPHYGIKWETSANPNTSDAYCWDIIVKYKMSFRNVR